MAALTAAQRQEYLERGCVMLPSVFTAAECARLVEHQMALHSGAATLRPDERYGDYGAFRRREGDGWGRTANQHLIDEVWRGWVGDPRLTTPLAELLGDEVQAVHSVYFYKSSTGTDHDHNFHADQTPLPGCVSAWVALTEVTEANGPLLVQAGSHRGRCVWHDTVIGPDGETDTAKRQALEAEIFEENRAPACPARPSPCPSAASYSSTAEFCTAARRRWTRRRSGTRSSAATSRAPSGSGRRSG